MRFKIKISYGKEPDGLGRLVQGWYVYNYGERAGCVQPTKKACHEMAATYFADSRAQVTA